MLTIPRNLAALEKIASKDAVRYALDCIQLRETESGYAAAATDGRRLALVTGPSESTSEAQQARLANAPNSGIEAYVPAKEFAKALKAMPKDKVPAGVISADGLTLTIADDNTSSTITCKEGRFPNYYEVATKPILKIKVNAKMLCELLQAAAAFTDDYDSNVEIGITTRDKPIWVKAKNSTGQLFEGLIMPLS